MNTLSRITTLLLFLVLLTPLASAQDHGVGVGASINGPTGVSAKLWLAGRHALAGAATFAVGDGPDIALIQGDYLVHEFDPLQVEEGLLALYYGGGVRLTFVEDRDAELGFRAPLGINYLLGPTPVDLFIELAPTLQVTDPDRLTIDGAIGVRYFFSTE